MQNQINERKVKISTKLPYAKDIQLGQDLVITIDGNSYIANCVKLDQMDRQDGTVDVLYTLKALIE